MGIQMGSKYEIRFVRNGLCPYEFSRWTRYFIVAMYWIIRIRYFGIAGTRYPIVTLRIRAGYIKSDDCKADYCAHECAAQEKEGDV